MIEAETHYDILGISPDVDQDKIHRAYTALLKEAQTIPDSPEFRAYMAKAKVAYQVLSHPESRAVYHQQLEMAGPPQRKWEVPAEDKLHPALYIAVFSLILGLPGLVLSGLYAWFTRKHRADT